MFKCHVLLVTGKKCGPRTSQTVLGTQATHYVPRTVWEVLWRHFFQSHSENWHLGPLYGGLAGDAMNVNTVEDNKHAAEPQFQISMTWEPDNHNKIWIYRFSYFVRCGGGNMPILYLGSLWQNCLLPWCILNQRNSTLIVLAPPLGPINRSH